MSLCVLKDFGVDLTKSGDNYESWLEYVSKLENNGYRNGGQVAQSLNFNSENLRDLILSL